MSLSAFSPATRDWFTRAFAGPTAVQEQAWPAIATGEHVLISAPTGSGKTLAAFLWALDRLATEPARSGSPRPPRRAPRRPGGGRRGPPRRAGRAGERRGRGRRAAHAPGVHLPAQGALLRHRAQPARAAA